MRYLSSLIKENVIYVQGNPANAIDSRYFHEFSSIYSLNGFEFTVTSIGKDSVPGTSSNTYITIDIMIMSNNMYENIFLPCTLEENNNIWTDIYGNKVFDKDCFDEEKYDIKNGLLFDGKFNTLSYHLESSKLYPLNYPIKFDLLPSEEGVYHILTYSDDLSDSFFWCTSTFSYNVSSTFFPTLAPSPVPTRMPTRVTQMPTPAPTRPPIYGDSSLTELDEGNSLLWKVLKYIIYAVLIISILHCLYQAVYLSNFFSVWLVCLSFRIIRRLFRFR